MEKQEKEEPFATQTPSFSVILPLLVSLSPYFFVVLCMDTFEL